ncbi:MAG TPA: hypothetical protein VL128_02995 [Candidatus Eisenbacteria bacterium]|nr:hypothetical protein [Candidatus Eisenbacteria bacterium]
MKSILFIIAITSLALVSSTTQSEQMVRNVILDERGSTPPLSQLYACAHELEGQEVDKTKYDECLGRILSYKYFEKGSVEVKLVSANTVDLRFVLESRELILDKLEFKLSELDQASITKWLRQDSRNLEVGVPYTFKRETATFYNLQQFFLSNGRNAVWSSKLNLDYSSGRASMIYDFVEGPPGPKFDSLPPNSPDCAYRIAILDYTGIDDLVPIPLLDAATKVKAFSCYDPQLIKADESRLHSSGIFQNVHYITKRERKDWKLKIEGTGNPFVVRSLNVKNYGQATPLSHELLSQLPLQPGQTYKSSIANESLALLRHLVESKDSRTAVVEKVVVSQPRTLDIEFAVLKIGENEVFINGSKSQ